MGGLYLLDVYNSLILILLWTQMFGIRFIAIIYNHIIYEDIIKNKEIKLMIKN